MRPAVTYAVPVILLVLAACGGGGSSSAPVSSGPVASSSSSSSSSSTSSSSSPGRASNPTADPPGFTKIAYGPAALEFGDLRLPSAALFGPGPYPVAIVVHGGCWTAGVGNKTSSASLADALTKHGIATWNIEYRAVGDAGGGWPGTFNDWSAATDYVRTLAASYPLDLSRVIVLGHSAGGHAALWIAARSKLPAGNPLSLGTPLPLIGAVDLDGPGELRPDLGYTRAQCGDAADQLVGGNPDAVPTRFAMASPSELLPLGVPQTIVSATFVHLDAATRYRDMAVASGDTVTIVDQHASGHFEMITPGTPEETQVESVVVGLLHP